MPGEVEGIPGHQVSKASSGPAMRRLILMDISFVQGKRRFFVSPLHYPVSLRCCQENPWCLSSPPLLHNGGNFSPQIHTAYSHGFTLRHCIRQAKHMRSAQHIDIDKRRLAELDV